MSGSIIGATQADCQDRDQTILDLWPLVHATRLRVLPYVPPNVDAEAVESEATLALIAAVDSWEPRKGSLSTWAISKIRWAIHTELRRQDHLTRNYREHLEQERIEPPPHVSLDALVFEESKKDVEGAWSVDGAPTPEEELMRCTLPAEVEAALRALSPLYRNAVWGQYAGTHPRPSDVTPHAWQQRAWSGMYRLRQLLEVNP